MAATSSPPARARKVPREEHGLYEPYDGPPPNEVELDAQGQRRIPPRALVERVDWLADKSHEEAQQLLLSTLHQFILAKTPSDVICERMGISMGSHDYLRKLLYKKMRDSVRAKDPFDYIAPMIAELEEVKATAWREVALAPPKEWSRRMRALEVIGRTQNDIGKMLQVSGLFDNSPMRAPLADDDADAGGANVLKDMAKRFLEGGYAANRQTGNGLQPGDQIVDDA